MGIIFAPINPGIRFEISYFSMFYETKNTFSTNWTNYQFNSHFLFGYAILYAGFLAALRRSWLVANVFVFPAHFGKGIF